MYKCIAFGCILQYTVVGTPCRRSSAEIEFLQSVRLARGWVLETLGLQVDLQPPFVGAGLRTLSLACGQNLGRWDTCLMKLALDWAWTGEWGTMCLKRSSASSHWLNKEFNQIKSMQKNRTHLHISEIFWFIEPTSPPVVVYRFNQGLSLDF